MAERRKLSDFTWGPFGDIKGWSRGLGVAVAAGVFLAFSGGFGTSEMSLVVRLAYWIGLLSLGTLWAGAVAHLVFGREPISSLLALRVIGMSLLIGGPFTVVVWLANNFVMNAHMPAGRSFYLFLIVTLISLVMTTINVLIEKGRASPPVISDQPPRFLERLPLKLRGAEIWAVESEDHYLRLHTSKGQDLILMRLADAIVELDGLEGAQVHRSWWVSRDAIADAKRGDGRATLTLKDGSEVPVSRTYAKVLRERNWI